MAAIEVELVRDGSMSPRLVKLLSVALKTSRGSPVRREKWPRRQEVTAFKFEVVAALGIPSCLQYTYDLSNFAFRVLLATGAQDEVGRTRCAIGVNARHSLALLCDSFELKDYEFPNHNNRESEGEAFAFFTRRAFSSLIQ